VEDDVAALHVGTRVFEFEGFIKGAQSHHVDLVVIREVDATEHGDEYGHDEGSIASEGAAVA
jgi:hypothetical protein